MGEKKTRERQQAKGREEDDEELLENDLLRQACDIFEAHKAGVLKKREALYEATSRRGRQQQARMGNDEGMGGFFSRGKGFAASRVWHI